MAPLIMTNVSFRHILRLTFVLFSLYLLGDAFYRWDGFKYYASFYEFLPSIALALILWSVLSIVTAMLIWITVWASEWIFHRVGLKLKIHHLILFLFIFALLGILIWIGKQFLISHFKAIYTSSITMQIKLIVSACLLLLSVLSAWLLRNKAIVCIGAVLERLTPLVWIFGICVMLSVPIVTYHTFLKPADIIKSQKALQSSIENIDRPNIIVVIFDALSAQEMSLHGYSRPTTPFIDEWSKSASFFKRVEANSNWTTPAMVSLATGKRIWTHQVYNIEGQVSDKRNENIMSLLKDNGYFNMAFITNDYASAQRLGISNDLDIAPSWRMPNGSLFETINTFLYRVFADKIRLYNWLMKEDFIIYRLLFVISPHLTTTIVEPEAVFNSFISTLDNNPPEPYMAWIHLYPPHNPYIPPEPYLGMFDPSSKYRTIENQSIQMHKWVTERYVGDNSDRKFFPPDVQKDVNVMRARYDEFIRYCDEHFKDFIKKLEERNSLDNTIIILTSDHGESFEHGFVTHGAHDLYETMTHIPLIIKEPGQSEGRIITDLVEQIDITSSILDFAKIPAPSWVEGRSFLPLMYGEKLPERPVFSMNFRTNASRGHPIERGRINVWKGNHKLMYHLNTEEVMLFDYVQDPHELNNLIDKEHDISQNLFDILKDNLKAANERILKEGKLPPQQNTGGSPVITNDIVEDPIK